METSNAQICFGSRLYFGTRHSGLAASFYVGLDTATSQCQVLNRMPDGTAMKMVGTAYSSQAEAQQAISSLPECNQ
jgi:hypothetical protein